MMDLTPEQQLAVDLEGTNIIVSAGAGSVKPQYYQKGLLEN